MKVYLAAPLFSAAEQAWNAELAAALRGSGHEVFLPQEKEVGRPASGIFAGDIEGLDWAEALVAIMDGPDPDSGTAWECGYAFGKKPIVLVRTDFRSRDRGGAPYNAMLTESASVRLDLPLAPMAEVASSVLEALAGMKREGR